MFVLNRYSRLNCSEGPFRQNVEDPWDGSSAGRADAQAVKLSNIFYSIVRILLLGATLILLTASMARAQSGASGKSETVGVGQGAVSQLDREGLLLAEDYIEALTQLRELADDYRVYFSRLDGKVAARNAILLAELSAKLRNTEYLKDYKLLTADMAFLETELSRQERSGDKSSESRRTGRLARSLRRELLSVNELIGEEVCRETYQQQEKIRDFYVYVAKCVADAQYVTLNIDSIRSQIAILQTGLEIIGDERQLMVTLELDELLTIPELNLSIPDIELPAPPAPPGPRRHHLKKHKTVAPHLGYPGKYTADYVQFDSLEIPSNDLPIVIYNSSGTVSASGWNRSFVQVRSVIEVVAGTADAARTLIEESDLRLVLKNKQVYIHRELPGMNDPSMEVLVSRLEIKVPMNNPLVCGSSFGSVDISNLRNGLKLNTSFCDVELNDLSGAVEAVNKMGSLRLRNVQGSMLIQNTHAPIFLTDCSGRMKIENESSPIVLSGTSGDATITNTDDISITDHIGKVDIECRNGMVVIKRLSGNLKVNSSFRPMEIEHVIGSVVATNIQAPIRIFEIEGVLTVNNINGLISASAPHGPIHLSNNDGDIVVLLNHALAGPSSIVSIQGTVNLQLSELSNIMLTTKTVGGRIQSSFPINIERNGNIELARLQLGKGYQPLKVTGTNTNIVLGMLR